MLSGRLPRRDDLGDLADDLFALTEDGDIDVVGQRLGVERGVTADDHQRVGVERSSLRTGTPARSTQFSTLV